MIKITNEWLENNINKWYAFNGGNTIYAFHSDKESIKPICKLTDKLKLYKGKSLAAARKLSESLRQKGGSVKELFQQAREKYAAKNPKPSSTKEIATRNPGSA